MLEKTLIACGVIALFAVSASTAIAADFKKFTLGGMEVIALSDIDAPAQDNRRLLVGLTDADAAKYLTAPGAMKNSINCFVVKTERETILFDTGVGQNGGALLPSLKAAGLTPEDIDAVVITHFHGDHIGGLTTPEGDAVFPAARLMVPRVEVEAMASAASKFIPAYAGRLQAFEWNQPVADGVISADATGHTPGHTVFLIEDGDNKLLIGGDLIHFGGIQLPVPAVAVTYDTDTEKAIASRKRWFDKASAENFVVATMHLPFPGIGKLSKDGAGYSFATLK